MTTFACLTFITIDYKSFNYKVAVTELKPSGLRSLFIIIMIIINTRIYFPYDYFQGCDYSDEDWSTLIGVIFAWSDLTCFGYIFDDSCSSYLKNEIYYYFGQYSDYYSDYYDYYYNYNDYYDYYSYYYGKKAEKTN